MLVAIEKTVGSLLYLNHAMAGDVTSLKGLLYFLCVFLGMGVLTSVVAPEVRLRCWSVLGVNAVLEMVMGGAIEWLIGVSILRWASLLATIAIVLTALHQRRRTTEDSIKCQFNTPRLKRIIHSVYQENNYRPWEHHYHRPRCSCCAGKGSEGREEGHWVGK